MTSASGTPPEGGASGSTPPPVQTQPLVLAKPRDPGPFTGTGLDMDAENESACLDCRLLTTGNREEDPWNSLSPMNPFKVPKTTIVLDFDGFDGDTTLDVPGHSFPLENDASMQKQLELLSERTLERFSDQEPVVVYMKTGDKLYGAKMAYPELLLPVSPEVDSRLKDAVKDADLVKLLRDGTFNASLPGDDLFLVELHTARLVIDQLAKKASKGSAPSVVWLRLSGLRHIVDRYTDESYQASHALRLIRELVER
ncbi:hypothetical protein HPB47_019185, partial [Ixodes persulcatus]